MLITKKYGGFVIQGIVIYKQLLQGKEEEVAHIVHTQLIHHFQNKQLIII